MALSDRAARARKRYLKHPSDAGLRYYLTLKARLGRWDDRYCRYFGVDTGVSTRVKQFIMRGFAAGLVPTSTTGGVHAPGSYHSKRRAADMGLRSNEIGTAKGQRKMEDFQRNEFRLRYKTHAIEIIGPINNLVVLRGGHSPLAEGTALENMHDNHVHGAF